MEPTWSISRRKLGSIFGFRQRTLRQSTASFSSTKKRFMILLTNSWPVRFVLYATAYHFPKTDSFATGGLNDFQVAINTLICSRSSSMLFSLSDSSSMWQESESLSSKSVLSLVSDPLSTTWVGAFRFERKKLWWEWPHFLKKHKLSRHENVFIEFENLDITGTYTLLVLNKGKNDWIDKILTLENLVMWINCIELPPGLNHFVLIWRTL